MRKEWEWGFSRLADSYFSTYSILNIICLTLSVTHFPLKLLEVIEFWSRPFQMEQNMTWKYEMCYFTELI